MQTDHEQEKNNGRKMQKYSTVSFPEKPTFIGLSNMGSDNHEKDLNMPEFEADAITQEIQKVLYENQRWSQPLNPPIKTRRKQTILSEIDDQGDNFIVINSENKKSVDAVLEAEDIQKLRQKARQISRQNQKLKQENLQLRLQKMKLASNSESMQLLQLKLEIQQLTKSISILQQQKQLALKMSNLELPEHSSERQKLSSPKVGEQKKNQYRREPTYFKNYLETNAK